MNAESIIRRLESFAGALPAAVAGITSDQARRKPPSGAWSILEIVSHLADEEEHDFGARLRFVLERRDPPWPPIDPEGWARERRYNEGDLAASVARFVRLRRASLAWLSELPPETDWSLAYEHPKFGPIRAGDLLSSWAAHDALHLRQIAKRLYELAGADGAGFQTDYAGPWGP